jgi:acid phosphatase class B
VMRGLSLVVQGNVGRKFLPGMTVQECEALRDQGMRRIREVIAMQSDHQPVPQNYF